MGTRKIMLGITLRWTTITIRGSRNTPSRFMLRTGSLGHLARRRLYLLQDYNDGSGLQFTKIDFVYTGCKTCKKIKIDISNLFITSYQQSARAVRSEPRGVLEVYLTGGSDGASYCKPKKIHKPEILDPKKYLASKYKKWHQKYKT